LVILGSDKIVASICEAADNRYIVALFADEGAGSRLTTLARHQIPMAPEGLLVREGL
jgi:hypothetical protein